MTNGIDRDDMELYACLGIMVRVAADMELRLQMIAVHLSESPYAYLWVHGARAEAATKLIGDLAKANPRVTEEEQEKLDALLRQVRPLLDRRHGYVHGAWSEDQSNPLEPAYQAMRFTKGKQMPRFDPLSKEDLGDLIAKLSDLLSALMEWFVRHINQGVQPADQDT
jgi:hypothetical protein